MKNKGKQLIIFIPYPDKSTRRFGEDCIANSRELFDVVKKCFSIKKDVRLDGQLITSASLIYTNTMKTADIADDSIFIMHTYGGEANASLWDDNQGRLTVKEALKLLETLEGIATASEFHFSICYSGLNGHIAPLWKEKYPDMKVFGMTKGFEGELYLETENRLDVNTQTDKDIKISKRRP